MIVPWRRPLKLEKLYLIDVVYIKGNGIADELLVLCFYWKCSLKCKSAFNNHAFLTEATETFHTAFEFSIEYSFHNSLFLLSFFNCFLENTLLLSQ